MKLEESKFEKAKKRVDDIKGFYRHALIYVLVNVFLLLAQMNIFEWGFDAGRLHWGNLMTPFFWGIGLLGHALHVFGTKLSVFRNWEERKIKEFMDKDDEDFRNTTGYN